MVKMNRVLHSFVFYSEMIPGLADSLSLVFPDDLCCEYYGFVSHSNLACAAAAALTYSCDLI